KANYNGKGAPRLVLFSPIAAEKMADPNFADAAPINKNLKLYADAMAEVCKANNVRFVDLFTPSKDLYAAAQNGGAASPMTFNGIHLTAAGNEKMAPIMFKGAIDAEVPSPSGALDMLRAAVVDKSEAWHDRYRTVDSYNIYGQRSTIGYQSGLTAD